MTTAAGLSGSLCVHYWVIEPAGIRGDGQSQGMCCRCGIEKLFTNYVDSVDTEVMAEKCRKGGRRRVQLHHLERDSHRR